MVLIKKLFRLASIPILAILIVFNLRRILFTFTVLFAVRDPKETEQQSADLEDAPKLLVLVACRNEARIIPDLCRSLSRISYPSEKLQVVLINDGSTDDTGEQMINQADGRSGWKVLHLPESTGKAGALNAALARFTFGEIIYVLDADHRPEPDALTRVVRYFEDPQVAGVSGFTNAINATASPSAYYATVESYTNQMMTMRAKDRLGLAPALLGSNCAYRRKLLNDCGGFRQGAFSEDSDLTVRFYQHGYRTRFARDVFSTQQVPQSMRGYMKQHIRWGRGLNDVARVHAFDILRNHRLPLLLRAELIIFSAGYLDRIALAGAGILALPSWIRKDSPPFPYRLILWVLLTPFAQILALFLKERLPRDMWVRLPLVPLFFTFDILAALRAALDTLFNRSRAWVKTERMTS